MASRHRSRERAVQILYQCDVRSLDVDEAIRATYDLWEQDEPGGGGRDQFMEELVRGTRSRTAETDVLISQHASGWRIERMPAVDRNVLRVAVYEMLEGKTPAPIVIDEALDLARKFSGDESVSFVNGVLDAVRRQLSTQ